MSNRIFYTLLGLLALVAAVGLIVGTLVAPALAQMIGGLSR